MTASGTPGLGLATGPNDGAYGGLTFLGLLELESGFGPAFGSVMEDGDFLFGTAANPGYSVIFSDMVGDVFDFGDDTSATGKALLTITGGDIQWRQVGSTSRVVSKYTSFTGGGSPSEQEIGTWVMVAPVPLPAAA